MKRVFSLLLAAMMALALLSPALAESMDDPFLRDRSLLRWSLAAVAELMGRACDRLESQPADSLGIYYESLSKIDLLRPYKVLVVELTAEQEEAARTALHAQSASGIAPALAEALNPQYSERYAQAMRGVVPEPLQYVESGSALVLLPYERHVAAVSFSYQNAEAACVMSVKENSLALDAAAVAGYARDFGLEGLNIRVYAGEEIEILLEPSEWTGDYDSPKAFADALTQSESRMRRMFAVTLGAQGDNLPSSVLGKYLKENMADNLLGAARLVAEHFLPLMQARGGDAMEHFMYANKYMIDTARDSRRAPEIAYMEEQRPDPAGTYLFVIERYVPDREPERFIDPVLQATLPARNIPASPEAADYIIRCKATYSDTPDASNASSAVYCPTTEIAVYDAHTGAKVCALGSVTRPMARGVITVQRGNTYYYPFLDQIWEKTSALFEE